MSQLIRIDFKELIRKAYSNKSIYFVLIVSFLSLIVALNMDRVYVAKIVLLQQEVIGSEKRSGFSAGKLGNLAQLAGIGLGDANVEKIAQLEILKSKLFILEFIRTNGLKKHIFANKWDAEKGKWKDISGLSKTRHSILSYFNEDYQIPASKEPDEHKLYERFMKDHFDLKIDKISNVITLSIYWKSPDEASRLTNVFVRQLNDYIRNRDLEYLKVNKDILEKKYSKVLVENVKLQLSAMIAEQVRKMTIAESKFDYAFKVIDPPIPNFQQSKPSYLGTVLASLLFSLILVLLFNLLLIEKGKPKSR